MDKLQIVKFDVRGTNPDNRVILERIPIKDKTCPWIVPNGTPYFAENLLVSLYNEEGGKLALGVDYWFEGEFPPFCEITGRSICSYIRLSERVRAQNDFVKVTYQSIGAWFVPRNNIEDWVKQIHEGKIPIPWSKVFNVPPELPPEFHSHSIKTEIGDWYELTFFFDYLANIYSTRDPSVYEDADRIINETFEQLLSVKEAQLKRINDHDARYDDPHDTTKFHLDLGNLDNFATATLAQDKAGVSSTLFSTPQGIMALSEDYEQDTASIMRSGVLPVSYFAGEGFIPPAISGSFEGLGSRSVSTGVCLENSGQLMILANHFDGRVDGLYFTTVDNYKDAAPEVSYTSYRYNPPDLANKGISVNRIISGSGNRAIMVGNYGTNDWYVSLTHHSFNPAGHEFVKTDMTAVLNALGVGTYLANEEATLLDMGNYLFLLQPVGNNTVGDRFALFRVRKADIINKVNVTWELLKLSYSDYDGVFQSNADYLQPFTIQRDGDNNIIRSGPWTFRQAATVWNRSGKPQAWGNTLSYAPGTAMFHVMVYNTFARDGIAIDVIGEMGFIFNPETGNLIFNNKSIALDMGFTDTTPGQRLSYLRDYYGTFAVIGKHGNVQATFLQDGTLWTPYPDNGYSFPLNMSRTLFSGFTSLESILVRSLDVQTLGGLNTIKSFNNKVTLSTPTGIYPDSVVYDAGAEVFSATDPATLERKVYYRKVTGGYQVRPSVSNTLVSPIKSRPLSNDVYPTNLNPGDPIVAVTGTAATLSVLGVEMGSHALTACAWSSTEPLNHLPLNPALRAPNPSDAILTFPLTHSKVVDPVTQTVTYKGETFYGLRQSLIDQIKEHIPDVYRSNTPAWSFTLHTLDQVNGGMFDGVDIGFLTLHYYDVANSAVRTQLVMVSLNVEQPAPSNPTLSMIIDLVVRDKPADVLGMSNVSLVSPGFLYGEQPRLKPSLSCYKNDGQYTCYNTGVFGVLGSSGVNNRLMMFFEANATTLKFSNIAQASFDWSVADPVIFIPGQGLTDINLGYNQREVVQTTLPVPTPFQYTGGAAAIYTKSGEYYLTASVYPETGWVVFFQEGIRLMIQGTAYQTLPGLIDLRDVDPDPRNKTFYLYATIEGNLPKYILSTIKLRRGNALLLVAAITTNDTQIVTIERKQPFVIGDYEMSYFREGGIIPVSTGLPQDEGVFKFLKYSELLP